jgi:hypothetical protein
MLQIAGIADVHYLTDHGNKKGLEAPYCLDSSVGLAVEHNVDILVDFGDQISVDHRLTRNESIELKEKCRAHYNQAAHIPLIEIDGNHCQFYRRAREPFSLDIQGFHIVVFITPTIPTPEGGMHVQRDYLDWLKKDLKTTSKKCIVLNHIGFSSHEEPIHRRHPNYFPRFYDNDQDVRNIFAKAGNVIVSISGHRHEDMMTLNDGVYHITQQSLTHATRDGKRACGASTHYLFDDKSITLRHFGLERPADMALSLP